MSCFVPADYGGETNFDASAHPFVGNPRVDVPLKDAPNNAVAGFVAPLAENNGGAKAG